MTHCSTWGCVQFSLVKSEGNLNLSDLGESLEEGSTEADGPTFLLPTQTKREHPQAWYLPYEDSGKVIVREKIKIVQHPQSPGSSCRQTETRAKSWRPISGPTDAFLQESCNSQALLCYGLEEVKMGLNLYEPQSDLPPSNCFSMSEHNKIHMGLFTSIIPSPILEATKGETPGSAMKFSPMPDTWDTSKQLYKDINHTT